MVSWSRRQRERKRASRSFENSGLLAESRMMYCRSAKGSRMDSASWRFFSIAAPPDDHVPRADRPERNASDVSMAQGYKGCPHFARDGVRFERESGRAIELSSFCGIGRLRRLLRPPTSEKESARPPREEIPNRRVVATYSRTFRNHSYSQHNPQIFAAEAR